MQRYRYRKYILLEEDEIIECLRIGRVLYSHPEEQAFLDPLLPLPEYFEVKDRAYETLAIQRTICYR